MAHDETSLIEEFREDFRAVCSPSSLWVKVAGGPYQQAGLPDVLCATTYGVSGVEFKFARTERQAAMKPAELIVEELSARQRQVLASLTNLNGPLRPRVVVGAEVEHAGLPGGRGTFALGLDYRDLARAMTTTVLEYMLALLNQKLSNPGACTVRPGVVTTQLRCRGEKWFVSDLLFGRVYAPATDAEQAKVEAVS